MKLKIEHLAPYSPYKLNYFVDFEDGDVAIYEMIGMFTDSGEIYLDGYETNLESKNCKPILRPLSDLTEDLLCISWIENIQDKELGAECPYDVWQVLFANHFDVFGLIEKGLAIDINTLN